MCVCEFRIQINNNNNLTYKAATTNNEFFKQISKAPCVHAIFKRYRTRPVIVFVAYTRQYKEAIHDQDYDEHPLNEEKSLFCVFCCFFFCSIKYSKFYCFFLCNRNFQLLADFYSSVYSLLHGFFFKLCQHIFFLFQGFLLTCKKFLLISFFLRN